MLRGSPSPQWARASPRRPLAPSVVPLLPAESFNYCSVPLTGQDAFLFVGIALLVAALVVGKLAPVWTLLVGASMGRRRLRQRGAGQPQPSVVAACWQRTGGPVFPIIGDPFPPSTDPPFSFAGGIFGIVNYYANLLQVRAVLRWAALRCAALPSRANRPSLPRPARSATPSPCGWASSRPTSSSTPSCPRCSWTLPCASTSTCSRRSGRTW